MSRSTALSPQPDRNTEILPATATSHLQNIGETPSSTACRQRTRSTQALPLPKDNLYAGPIFDEFRLLVCGEKGRPNSLGLDFLLPTNLTLSAKQVKKRW